MTSRISKTAFAAVLLGLGALGASPAMAQDAVISAAKAAGTVGEQADGYLGIKGNVSGDVRSAVDALNIKRRAAYTDLAAKRGVTVQDMAAVTGCQTLAGRVSQGQIYRIGTGDWQAKGAGPIALPDYCATAAK
ncbi:MAG TPA: YdbL family protein [Sphingobium sp.]|nr:YdbL family protein [Sphingobium sp.]